MKILTSIRDREKNRAVGRTDCRGLVSAAGARDDGEGEDEDEYGQQTNTERQLVFDHGMTPSGGTAMDGNLLLHHDNSIAGYHNIIISYKNPSKTVTEPRAPEVLIDSREFGVKSRRTNQFAADAQNHAETIS